MNRSTRTLTRPRLARTAVALPLALAALGVADSTEGTGGTKGGRKR